MSDSGAWPLLLGFLPLWFLPALWSQWLVAADEQWAELTGAYRDSLFETVEQLLLDADQVVFDTLTDLTPRLAAVLEPMQLSRLMAAAAAAGIDL